MKVSGLSMGGPGPLCRQRAHLRRREHDALLVGRDQAEAIRALPVWAFHGAKDPVVPVEESERLVNALRRMGGTEVKLIVYPEAQHDSWTETYDNPAFYEWLLSHERGQKSPVSAQPAAKTSSIAAALLAADTTFAELAAQKGTGEAFFAFAVEGAIEAVPHRCRTLPQRRPGLHLGHLRVSPSGRRR